MVKKTRSEDIDNNDTNTVNSLHSDEIRENLSDVNMDAWNYIYQNFVNPDLKKKEK